MSIWAYNPSDVITQKYLCITQECFSNWKWKGWDKRKLDRRLKNCGCLLAYNHFFIWGYPVKIDLLIHIWRSWWELRRGDTSVERSIPRLISSLRWYYQGQESEIGRWSGDRSRPLRRIEFRAKTAGRRAQSCPHLHTTNPVQISTHPPHPRWWNRIQSGWLVRS